METLSLLKQVTTGKIKMPPRICIYGEHGIGKSTFASQFPDPIFIQTESGLDNIECHKFPLCTNLDQFREQISALANEEHKYKSLVIDSIDWLEKLVHEDVAKKHGKQSIADFDFGQGYQKGLEIFCGLLKYLDKIRAEKAMNIILVSHCAIKEHRDPLTAAYNRYTLSIRNNVADKVLEWCDCVSFINIEIMVISEKSGFTDSKRGKSNSKRFLLNETTPGYQAKNRYNLPGKIELDFETFWNLINKEK